MIDLNSLLIDKAPSYEEGAKFLNTKYRDNQKRIGERFFKPLKEFLTMNECKNSDDVVSFYINLCKDYKAYSYEEAFKIENPEFRASIFSLIDVSKMIDNLGHERLVTEGIELVNKTFVNGTFKEEKLTQIYELHKVFGKKLELNEDLFAIKCWCTSTNEEHWLWVNTEEGLKNDPLSAIASTCKVYRNMLGKIKHIIRQGDVFLFEMKEKVDVNENDEVVSMDKESYFSLLKSQS